MKKAKCGNLLATDFRMGMITIKELKLIIIIMTLLSILIACSNSNEKKDEKVDTQENPESQIAVENLETEVEEEMEIEGEYGELTGNWYVVMENGDKNILDIEKYIGEEFFGYWNETPVEGWISNKSILIHILDYQNIDALRNEVNTWTLPGSTLEKTIGFLENDENIYSILKFEITEGQLLYEGIFQKWEIYGVHGDYGDYLKSGHGETSNVMITRNDQNTVESGSGKVLFDDGSVKYIGEIQDGKPHGKGYLYNNDGSILASGVFKNGDLHCTQEEIDESDIYMNMVALTWGCGVIYDEYENPIYIGDFYENEMHGFGFLHYPDGNLKYEGEFANGQPHGEGSEDYSNGLSRYQGTFDNGMYNGEGRAFYPNGDIRYEGEWNSDVASGWGRVYINNNSVYEGYFENGVSGNYEITRANINTIYTNGKKSYDVPQSWSIQLDEEQTLDLILNILPQTKAIKAFSKFVDYSQMME